MTFRTARSLLAALLCLAVLVFCPPARAALNVEETRTADGRLDRVVIENDWLGAEISSLGGKLARLYDRRTGREFAAQPDTLMQGVGKRRDWVSGNEELLAGVHELSVARPEPGRVVVEARYEASAGNFAGLAFTVVYELTADRPALDVTHRAESRSGKTAFDLNIHNMLALAGFPAGSSCFYAGSADGPVRLPLPEAQRHPHNLVYNVAEPWVALADRASGEGLAFILHDRAGLENFYIWAGSDAATIEWVYGRTSLEPAAERDRWEAGFSVVPLRGLGTLLGAGPGLIYSLDQAEGRGRLALFSPAGSAPAQVTLSRAGRVIADRQVSLSADVATPVAFPLPAEAGVHEIEAVVKTPGATVAFTAPVAVGGAERPFAQATHEIRRRELEGVRGFYYYFDRLSLSPDVTVPLAFGLRGKGWHSGSDLRLVIEAPAAVRIASEYGNEQVSEIEVDGEPYRRYELPSRRRSTSYSAVQFTASLDGQLDQPLPVYYYARWNDGEQPRQTLPLDVVPVGPAPRLEQIRVGLELRGTVVANYPGFLESLERAGFNYVATGVTSWSLGAEPRQPDGAYRDLIEPIERAGVTVSTGNLGYPFSRYSDVWEKRYGAYEIAGTLHYPEKSFEDFDVEDSKAVTLEGERIAQMCPSYRGRFFDKVLDNVRLLIDYGYTTLLYDEETWGRAREICYCPRCRDRFAGFLAERYPALEPLDPRKIAAAPDRYAELHAAWWDFRTDLVAEIYTRMKQVALEHGGPAIQIGTYVSAGVGGGDPYGAITQRMTDYRKVAEGADFLLPMYYSASLRHSRRVGDVAGFLWREVGDRARPFMALSPARTYEYERIVQRNLPPAVAIKYQMFEAFSQGTEGIVIWAPPSALEGALSFRYMAEAVRAIAPVEEVVVHGELIDDPRTTNARVHARGIRHGGRSVLLVAEYSNDVVTTEVAYASDAPRTVVDLETGETVGALGPGDPTFEVTLDDRRARLFLVE